MIVIVIAIAIGRVKSGLLFSLVYSGSRLVEGFSTIYGLV